jgi:hypothetical protein
MRRYRKGLENRNDFNKCFFYSGGRKMVEYAHRENDTIQSYTYTYSLKEERIRADNKYYLIVLETDEENRVKGAVVKGRIDKWKTRMENGNYISEISLLSHLAKKNKRYERVIDNLEKKLSKRYKVSPNFC